MEKQDVYETITNKIISSLENGTIPWRRPWVSGVGGPHSISTGKSYQGINHLYLGIVGDEKGYTSSWWGTYKAISALGGQVRKNEKHSIVTFWRFIEPKDATEKERKANKKIPLLRSYPVFCADQADGLPEKYYTSEEQAISGGHESAEKVIHEYVGRYGIGVSYGGDRAFYRPSTDEIKVPYRAAFVSEEEFYATIFHEMAHSTGHPSRLAREGISGDHVFGDNEYSKEELIAEIGSSFIAAGAGVELTDTVQKNRDAYIGGWLKKLQSDKRLIVTAAGAAQKAADMALCIEKVGEKPEESLSTAA